MLHRHLFCCVLLLHVLFATAQDPFISQFFANRMYLNPAFTGIEDGLQANITARNQWYAADKGYSFYTVSAEIREPCWNSGFGLMLTQAREGLSPLVSTREALTYSYGGHRGSGFSGAIQCSFDQKHLDWSRFTFSDELDPVFGDIYGSAVADGIGTVMYTDFATGVLYRWNGHEKAMNGLKFQTRWHVGLAVNHLWSFFSPTNAPDESFFRTNTEVPSRITMHGGVIIPLTFLAGVNNGLLISPNFRFESQGSSPLNLGKSQTLFSGGAYFIFMSQFTFGALYHNRSPLVGTRHTSAVTFAGGFSNQPRKQKTNGYYLGFSIDLNPNGLGWQSKNTFEFNVRYTFRGLKTFCTPDNARRYVPGGSTGCPIWN